jgi:Copper transport outer membrane protein, MctB
VFDLRYHVISLVAVFLALVLGILVGVAISDPELANRTELRRQREEIAVLNERLQAAADRSTERDAAERFVDAAYPVVMHDRLAGKRVVVVFVGSIDKTLRDDVAAAVRAAGAAEPAVRALAIPLRADAVASELDGAPALAGYRGEDHLSDLGRDLGRELAEGGRMPLWDALEATLVAERHGPVAGADAVVVARTVKPQGGETGNFLLGFYSGIRSASTVVGVERSGAMPSTLPTFRRVGFSSVGGVETKLGRVALAVLLAGGAQGSFGVQEDGKVLLPPITPVEPTTTSG